MSNYQLAHGVSAPHEQQRPDESPYCGSVSKSAYGLSRGAAPRCGYARTTGWDSTAKEAFLIHPSLADAPADIAWQTPEGIEEWT